VLAHYDAHPELRKADEGLSRAFDALLGDA
jgi:hypothetical protein